MVLGVERDAVPEPILQGAHVIMRTGRIGTRVVLMAVLKANIISIQIVDTRRVSLSLWLLEALHRLQSALKVC
jgi:hypothetical protein